MKLLIEFFPIVLFFIAFKIKGIFIATLVALIASVSQVGYLFLTKKKIEPMMWISLCIIVIFGGATLLFKNEMFIKWKPTVLYWLFATILLVSALWYKKNIIQLLMSKQISLNPQQWKTMNTSWIAFFYSIGVVNLVVAYTFSTATWVNFKLFGILGLILAFGIVQSFLISSPGKKQDKG